MVQNNKVLPLYKHSQYFPCRSNIIIQNIVLGLSCSVFFTGMIILLRITTTHVNIINETGLIRYYTQKLATGILMKHHNNLSHYDYYTIPQYLHSTRWVRNDIEFDPGHCFSIKIPKVNINREYSICSIKSDNSLLFLISHLSPSSPLKFL